MRSVCKDQVYKGSIVQLKSGGPQMTVDESFGHKFTVIWCDNLGVLHRTELYPHCFYLIDKNNVKKQII